MVPITSSNPQLAHYKSLTLDLVSKYQAVTRLVDSSTHAHPTLVLTRSSCEGQSAKGARECGARRRCGDACHEGWRDGMEGLH